MLLNRLLSLPKPIPLRSGAMEKTDSPLRALSFSFLLCPSLYRCFPSQFEYLSASLSISSITSRNSVKGMKWILFKRSTAKVEYSPATHLSIPKAWLPRSNKKIEKRVGKRFCPWLRSFVRINNMRMTNCCGLMLLNGEKKTLLFQTKRFFGQLCLSVAVCNCEQGCTTSIICSSHSVLHVCGTIDLWTLTIFTPIPNGGKTCVYSNGTHWFVSDRIFDCFKIPAVKLTSLLRIYCCANCYWFCTMHLDDVRPYCSITHDAFNVRLNRPSRHQSNIHGNAQFFS